MRLAIDIRPLLQPFHSGVQEYTVNLLAELFKSSHEFILFSSGQSDEIHSRQFRALLAEHPAVQRRHLWIPNRFLNRGFQFLRWPRIDRFLNWPDAFFAPNFNFFGFSRRTKLIITVHDLSFARNPEFFSSQGRRWASFVRPRQLAHRASHLIAMSESTKADLVELFGVAPEKVSVVYSGILPQFRPLPKHHPRFQVIRDRYHLPGRYVLSLGTLEPRKNLVGLIRAYSALVSKQPSVPALVLAGPPGWLFKDIIKEARHSAAASKIIFTGPVSEPDRVFVYNMAAAFVYPSFLEGFGFPPLEAMACGVATITSHTSSLPEAVGTAALTIDPMRLEEITEAMAALLTDWPLRQRLIAAGLKQVKRFTWQRSAQETLAVFEKVIHRSY